MIELTPDIRPEPKQFIAYEKLFDNICSYIGFGGGAGGGKSWLGAEWLITNCYRYSGSKWFMGRDELTRLMGSAYVTYNKVCSFHSIPKNDWMFNGQYHYIRFKNPKTGKFDEEGSRIDLLDLKYLPSDPEYQRLGSLEYTGGWIEEAGEVHILAFDMLKTRVGRHLNREFNLFPAKILITCNPTQNWLYRLFYKPFKNNTLPKEYAFIQSLYKDNSYTAEQYGKQLDQITDPVLRARLKSGLWEYSAEDASLIDYDSIIDLFTNSIEEDKRKYLTADVARYGSDKSVIGIWQGFDLQKIVVKSKQGTDVTADNIRELLRTENIPYSYCVIDEDGIGGGIVDTLRGVKGFVNNSRPQVRVDNKSNIKENYANLKAQCAYMLAEKVNNHQITITATVGEAQKEEIIEDLQQLKRKDVEKEAPLQIISKEEVKEAIGRSPDFGDMLMMRMYFELDKPRTVHFTDDVGGLKPLYPEFGIN